MKAAYFLAPLALLSMAGCGDSGKSPDVAASADVSEAGAPESKPGLSVSDGVLILPAVAGRPGAAYFTIANNGDKPTSLAAVYVEGTAKAEIHETMGGKMQPLLKLDLPVGATVKFERGGKHVMLFDLADTLAAGSTTEMTLTFAGGDKLSTPLRIESAGGMPDHGAMR
jgi:copper(I)-binding protein